VQKLLLEIFDRCQAVIWDNSSRERWRISWEKAIGLILLIVKRENIERTEIMASQINRVVIEDEGWESKYANTLIIDN
jgi:hypothetical protein